MLDEKYLKSEEKIVFSLRALYSKYGYLPFKMSKFEEYDLYAKNKEFLVSDSVITFTDTNGKLLALKPDVTLSIIKNVAESKGIKQKVYYSENVYRISGSTSAYKEIMQTGLECIGDLDLYDLYEVIDLASKSLESISKKYVLEISHMGILSSVLECLGDDKSLKEKVVDCIKKKSVHQLKECLDSHGASKDVFETLSALISTYGKPNEVIDKLEKMKVNDSFEQAVKSLKELCKLLSNDNITLDFSIVNDMNYYNGIVFNGYIENVCECVLFGGSYDNLLNKMGKSAKGIGFAIYTDLLLGLYKEAKGYDVDVLLVYNESTPIKKVQEITEWFISQGKSVSAQREIPKGLRYKEIKEMEG